jgi:hypothetical protein
MRLLYIFSFFYLAINIVVGQNKLQVTGQVKDAQTKAALEFCSISALNPKDSLITVSVTNNKGFFTASLDPGAYNFIVSFIGYKTDTTEMMVITANKFIGLYKLEPDVKFLNEISVKTNSAENQLDRDVQIVTDKMKEGASNTKEVLDKINGVEFDRYNNSIKVDNDSKVIILVDGLEKDQEYIKNLSPDRLKKVEIIRDPGGRYALEGYSAVINIILKKDYQGTEIFVSDRGMVDPDALKTEYIPVQNNASATVNYVYNKLNIYGKYSSNYNNFNLQSSSKKEYNNGLAIDNIPIDSSDMNTKVKQLYNNYTLGADFYINPKHTISFESDLSTQPWKNNTSEERYNVIYSDYGNQLYNYYTKTINQSENLSSYNSLFYEGKINENNVFNSTFTYSNYSDKYTNLYKESFTNGRVENGTNDKNSTKFYIDFIHTFKNNTSIQVGYGNTWAQTNSNYTVDTIENKFEYSDLRHKFYGYYSIQAGKKVSIKFGGAGETSEPNSNGQKNSYFIFQPYADIKYKPSEKIDFKIKYRSSSNYPNISQTNPFTYMIDQYSVRTGNPYLSPEVTHKISLQTDIMGGLLTLEPYYHFSKNYITEIGTLRQDSIFEYNYSNMGNYKNYGVEARFTVPFGKSLFMENNFDFFKSSINYSNKNNKLNDWSMSSQLVYVREKEGTVVGFQYQNNLRKYISAQGYNKEDNDFWILFVQQPFFKKKLSVMLLYFTPITWGVDFNQGSYIKTDTYTESRFNDISFLKNMFMLEVSYRFNKGKTVNKKEKEIEQKDEKGTKGIL